MVTIRRAELADVADVVAVGHATWPRTYEPIAGPDYVRRGLGTWWTVDACLPAVRDGRTLVALDSDDGPASRVVGMASWSREDDTVTIWKLYVLPEFQGRGVGRSLLHGVLEEVRRDDATTARLAFLAGNEAARGFYEANGFEITATERGGLGGPDNVWMERELV